jgi:predicted nucleotidyltransferase
MKRSKNNVVGMIKEKVRQIDPDAEVILFGSRARGEARPDSDWDILILVDDEATFERERYFRHQLFNLELTLGEAFSVFIFNKSDWNLKYRNTDFYRNVINEGLSV